MEPFVHTNKRFLEIEKWRESEPLLKVGFTTREGGVSAEPYTSFNLGYHVGDRSDNVTRNRQLLADDLQFPLQSWIGTQQVHGSSIKKIERKDAGDGAADLESAISSIDGVYTTEKHILLTSLYADCVPLFFLASDAHTIGLAHAGWRGTVQKIGPKMIKVWTDIEEIPLKSIKVAIGPCIGRNAYEVDQVVIDAVNDCLSAQSRPYVQKDNGKYLLDLRELNKQLLLLEGLEESQILTSEICTVADNRMFSYRNEGGKTGRMMSFIGFQ